MRVSSQSHFPFAVRSTAFYSDKILSMIDNIHHFWITATTLVALWIYGKYFTMGDQFGQSTDEARREMRSLIELGQGLYLYSELRVEQ